MVAALGSWRSWFADPWDFVNCFYMVLQQRSQSSKFTVRRLKFALEIVSPPSENTWGGGLQMEKEGKSLDYTIMYVCLRGANLNLAISSQGGLF